MASAHIKRFMERWFADPNFENNLSPSLLKEFRIQMPAKLLSKLYDKKKPLSFCNCANTAQEKNCQKFDSYKISPKETLNKSLFQRSEEILKNGLVQSIPKSRGPLPDSNHIFTKWMIRQHKRIVFQFNYLKTIFLNIELSKGCSNQCWFCGFSAPLFQGFFAYQKEYWDKFLNTLADIFDKELFKYTLYYRASEPFDNPDYEKFIDHHKQVFGSVPRTITASAVKSLARTKKFIKKYSHVAFSINKKEDLDALHRYFSPEELKDIQLYLAFNNKCYHKTSCGRARGKQKDTFINSLYDPLSGFAINMVDKTIVLSIPTLISDLHPNNFLVLDSASFTSIEDLAEKIKTMIANNMIEKLEENDIVSLFPDFKLRLLKDGFAIDSPIQSLSFTGPLWLRSLGRAIKRRDQTVAEIAAKLKSAPTYLNRLFEEGLLNEKTIAINRHQIR